MVSGSIMTIHSHRVNAVIKRPARPQMPQRICRKRSPHAGLGGCCALFSAAGGTFSISANDPAMLAETPTVVEV
jgi:hypothetical protein